MKHSFQIEGIDYPIVEHFFQFNDEELAEFGAIRQWADQKPGFPCRVSLEDAEPGEELILFPFKHHDVDSPYQATGPIYVRKGAKSAQLQKNELPKMLEHRLLSLRGYNSSGMMLKAETINGNNLKTTINELFGDQSIHYIQIHNAGPGCYNCTVKRV